MALKLVLPGDRGTTRSSQGPTRLLREAQALAKLSHPNVVAVHDVGAIDEQVWLAMEFVEGETLTDWAKRRPRPRPWREVVEIMTSAAEGLAAAHGAGLLHRDFKPDNVMVGRDGRVRVMDFGLARARRQEELADLSPSFDDETTSSITTSGALSVELTQAGAIMGTPSYMAPEQFRGDDVTAAADQFALCVTMWELLYDARPFAGATLVDLALSVSTGHIQPPPRGARVPRWLRRICERGMSPDPALRFPSVNALLAALASARRWSKRRGVLSATVGLALLVAGALGYARYGAHAELEACAASGRAIAEVWNETRRADVRAGLLAVDGGFVETSAEQVMPWLDRHAEEWRAAQTEVCLDHAVHERLSEDELERAQWCLEARRMEFAGVVENLALADKEVAIQAISAATGLQRIAPCRDKNLLRRLDVPPSESREQVRAVLEQLSRASALGLAGKFERARRLAEDALTRAEGLSWAPLTAEARAHVGGFLSQTGAYDEAEETLTRAYFEAANAGASSVAAAAATELVLVIGYRLARQDEGLHWGQLADVELTRIGAGEDDLRRAALLTDEGLIFNEASQYDAAKQAHERSLAIRVAALGEHHPDVATALNNLANTHLDTGEHDKAMEYYERALAVTEDVLGPEHPGVASSLNNLALVHSERGDHARALPLLERALATRVRALGPNHADVADSLVNLATTYRATGDNDEAKELYARALKTYEKAFGPEHPRVAIALNNLATISRSAGDYDEAKAMLQRALAIRERALDEDHPLLASTHYNLALVLFVTEEREAAKAGFERALAMWERKLGPEHPNLAHPLTNLSEVAAGDGRWRDAVALAERAVKLRADAHAPPRLVARSTFALAEALWGAGQRQRARARAREAADIYRPFEDKAKALAEVETWLEEHP